MVGELLLEELMVESFGVESRGRLKAELRTLVSGKDWCSWLFSDAGCWILDPGFLT